MWLGYAGSSWLFLYRQVLAVDLPWLDNVVRAKRPQRVPTVLSRDEVLRLLVAMEGRPWLLASLLYGTAKNSKCTYEGDDSVLAAMSDV